MKGVSDGVIDAAFRKVRKNSIGFHIWKVEVIIWCNVGGTKNCAFLHYR